MVYKIPPVGEGRGKPYLATGLISSVLSRWKCNDQEPIWSNYTYFPNRHTGKEHEQSRRHKETQHKRKTKTNRCPPGYPKHNEHIVKDQREADEQIQLE